MKYWGLSHGHHDAAAVVLENNKILLAKRFGRKDILSGDLANLREIYGVPDKIFLHENKFRDAWRKIKIGDWSRLLTPKMFYPVKPIQGNHHLSHASAGFYTSNFQDALIIVADAIGELESLAVYRAHTGKINPKPLFVLKYPNSLGLFYSYNTALVGMVPNQDENKLMEMSRTSRFYDYEEALDKIIFIPGELIFKCSKDIHKYPSKIVTDPVYQKWIASTTQNILETFMFCLIDHFIKDNLYTNIVFSGGVAYNKLLCSRIMDKFRNIKLYVPSHPGDAGSAYGAILQHIHTHIALHNGVMFNEDKVQQE